MFETKWRRKSRSAGGGWWCGWGVRELGLNKSNMDGADEFASGEVEDPIAWTIIALLSNEHATKCIGGS
jgi:hypothetical protein